MVGLAPETGASFLVEPRLLGEDDIPWMHALCKKRYSDKYDFVTTEGWLRNIVFKQPVLFYPSRTENAVCISMLSITPWLPGDVECNIVLICAAEGCMWEAMKLLRGSIEWAKTRKCKLWRLSSDTDYDLWAMARRLGAEEQSPRFVLRF